uniref:glycosyltransferase family protein n=1 Tax=Aliarcobacter sp. TaxID=2321116 RepID=UPI004047B7CE
MQKHYKIVHCGIFNEKDNGNFFYGLERKISHGLIQNGHFVYDFSYRDIEKNFRFLGIKDSGLKKMNEKLIQICKNIDADILFLAKAEKIDKNTLIKIKEILPNIKIVQWYVDHLIEKNDFFEKLDCMDVFYYANAKELQNLSNRYENTVFSFFPNISDPAFDKRLEEKKINDVIYIARDYKEDVRTKFAVLLKDYCDRENINLKIYASLGNPAIFGNDFQRAIAQTKIAINFNRDDYLHEINQEKILGASDRMAQFLGCGICTFSPRIKGFEKLYKDKEEIVYFESIDDCCQKLIEYLKNGDYMSISKNGQEKTFEIVNAKRVTQFMLDLLFENNSCDSYEWSEYKYKKGIQI